MIRLRSLRYYKIGYLKEAGDAAYNAFSLRTDKNLVRKTGCLLNCYFDILGRNDVQFQAENASSAYLLGFRGFLLEETDAGLTYIGNLIRPTFIYYYGYRSSKCFFTKGVYDDEKCIAAWRAMTPDHDKIKYYTGWWLVGANGSKHFLDLTQFYHAYGDDLTSRVYNEALGYIKGIEQSSAIDKVGSINTVIRQMVQDLPGLDGFNLLAEPLEVNLFIENMYCEAHAKCVENKGDLEAFHKSWLQLLLVVESFFIEAEFFSESSYPLYRGEYQSGKQLRGLKGKKSAHLTGLMTPVPRNYAMREDTQIWFEQIESDTKSVILACEKIRLETITAFRDRKARARRGMGINLNDESTPKSDRDVRAAVWEVLTYTKFSLRDRRYLYGDAIGLKSELALLTFHTLQPYLYLLVAEHPLITPSWLLRFTVDGILQDGRLVVSEKARKGLSKAQQAIATNAKSRLLIDEMLELTQEARSYLKSIGDDSCKFLLLGAGGGYEPPAPIKSILGATSKKYDGTPLCEELRRLDEKLYSRITLRTLRVSVAVGVFFKTGSIEAFAKALGHDGVNPELIHTYLPDSIYQYYLEDSIGLFHNWLLYQFIPEKQLKEVFGCSSMNELDSYLRKNGFHPVQDKVELNSILNSKSQRNTGLVPISEAICIILVTLGPLVEERLADGLTVSEAALLWYQTFCLLRQVINMHEDGLISVCSNDVCTMFRVAKYSPELAIKLKLIIG